MVTEAEERFEEKYGIKGSVIIMAPTGKAALNAGGVTMASKNGLSIPTKDMEDRRKNLLKPGKTLLNLQQRLQNNFLVILDEYSMTSSGQFYWINSRLQQAKSSDVAFGGVLFIMFGDPGQLPPVGGTPLWCNKTSDNKQLGQLANAGHEFYKKIETVMCLTEVRRQEGFFKDFLGRLRDGKNSEHDWKQLNQDCSTDKMSSQAIERFQSNETTFLFSTNELCRDKNTEKLINLNSPIVLMSAIHDEPKSARKSGDSVKNLQTSLFLSVGSKVMLLWNIGPTALLGLVNGSSGTVKDFIYATDSRGGPPELPLYVIIEFLSYTGESFFNDPAKSKWVPLPPSTAEWSGYDEIEHSRKQFPISLAWALTTWKAQGMTCKGTIVAPFPLVEKQAGLTYVNLSRLTKWENLCIGQAIPLERLTVKISKCKGMNSRIIEDNRLNDLWEKTKLFFEKEII